MSNLIHEFKRLRKEATQVFYASKDSYFPDVTLDEFLEAYDAMIAESQIITKRLNKKEHSEYVALFQKHGRELPHFTAYMGLSAPLKLSLLEKRQLAFYNKKDEFGMTPKDYAKEQGYTEIVNILEEFETKRVKRNES